MKVESADRATRVAPFLVPFIMDFQRDLLFFEPQKLKIRIMLIRIFVILHTHPNKNV
jgi:hypothetical protein